MFMEKIAELFNLFGYRETEWENEWSKANWYIRIFTDEIEVFNEPRINTPGVYYKCKTSLENLTDILQDIESKNQ